MMPTHIRLICGEALNELGKMKPNSVDLILTSPPYEDARSYGGKTKLLRGEEWVAWALEIYLECLRVSKGLVAWVVAGKTTNRRWSAVPMLLAADLHRRGVCLRNPPLYVRYGIPGSGGKDWLANRYETIVCAQRVPGPLPWADPTACGHPPKYGVGGPRSGWQGDERASKRTFKQPKLANPGNIIDCGAAGGGHMGDRSAHDHQAPFPEKLSDFFVKSFCPPSGVVLDPFIGSGTTAVSCISHGRKCIGIDINPDYVKAAEKRVKERIKHGHSNLSAIVAAGPA